MVSRMAVMVQSSVPPSAGESLACSRFHATRQRAEQKRACSRRGVNEAPHCSHALVSVTTLHVTRNERPDLRGVRLRPNEHSVTSRRLPPERTRFHASAAIKPAAISAASSRNDPGTLYVYGERIPIGLAAGS